MEFASFDHKGLKQPYEDDRTQGVPADMLAKVRRLMSAMDTAKELDELKLFPGWAFHPLKGNFAGYWSLTVTRNWRLIFRYDEKGNIASKVDLIDYHGN